MGCRNWGVFGGRSGRGRIGECFRTFKGRTQVLLPNGKCRARQTR